jgi:hypothetical protein
MESSPMLCKQGVTGSIPVTSTNISGVASTNFFFVAGHWIASLFYSEVFKR